MEPFLSNCSTFMVEHKIPSKGVFPEDFKFPYTNPKQKSAQKAVPIIKKEASKKREMNRIDSSVTNELNELRKILNEVSLKHKVKVLEMTGKSRKPNLVKARNEAMYLIKNNTNIVIIGVGNTLIFEIQIIGEITNNIKSILIYFVTHLFDSFFNNKKATTIFTGKAHSTLKLFGAVE